MEQQASALVLSHHSALRWVLAPAGASGCTGELCQPHPCGPWAVLAGAAQAQARDTSHPWPVGAVTGSQQHQVSPNPALALRTAPLHDASVKAPDGLPLPSPYQRVVKWEDKG